MKTSEKGNLVREVARMGLPPLRADDGLVELSIQEYRAKARWVIENYPADRIPKVGDDIQSGNTDVPGTFVVTEVKHLLVPRSKETIRAVLVLVKRAHQI
jgi:hypothetical protein